MPGATWADPLIITGNSGSQGFTPTASTWYLKLDPTELWRVYTFAWTAPAGYWNAYKGPTEGSGFLISSSSTPPSFRIKTTPQPVWIKFQGLTVGQPVTFDWSSEAPPPSRPFRWEDAQAVSGVPGSVSYDNIAPDIGARWYTITATTTDDLLFYSDEPNAYIEAYSGTDLTNDVFLDDGENHGTELYDMCRITAPTIGTTYHVVVYPAMAEPATATLSWRYPTVPGYVVANDDIANSIALPFVAGEPGSVVYDNTGATRSGMSGDWNKSVWYHLPAIAQPLYARFDAVGAEDPDAALFKNVTGTWVMQSSVAAGSIGTDDGNWYAFKLDAGATYKVAVRVNADQDVWETAGSLSWTNEFQPTNAVKEAPEPLTDQNFVQDPLISGYADPRWYSVTVPVDGSFQIVREGPSSSQSTGVVWWPDATSGVTIPYRTVGSTVAPVAMILQAGDQVLIQYGQIDNGLTLRWGVSQEPVQMTWRSTKYGDYLVETGQGSSPLAGVETWSGGTGITGYGQAGMTGETYVPGKSWGSKTVTQQVIAGPGMHVDRCAPQMLADTGGTGPSPAVANTTLGTLAQNYLGGFIQYGMNGDLQDVDYQETEARIVANRLRRFVSSVSFPADPLQLDYDPIIGSWNVNGITAIPGAPSVGASTATKLAFLKTRCVIEWSEPLTYKLNAYRVVSVAYQRYCASPFMGSVAIAPADPFSIEAYILPGSTVNDSWLSHADIIAGQLVAKVANAPLAISSGQTWIAPDAEPPGGYPGGYAPISAGSSITAYQTPENLIAEDITGGAYPTVNQVLIDSVLAVTTDLYEDRGQTIDYQGIVDDMSAANGGGINTVTWPAWRYAAFGQQNIQFGRRYPDQYRVSYYPEDLSPIELGPMIPTDFDIVDGVYNSVAEAGEYIYTGEVDTSQPPPHLWFVFRRYAFGAEHVLIYGTGLGTPQSEYNGRMWLDWGPNYATSDLEPTVVGWTTSAATANAYTGEGVIFPGTDAAPPVVDVEIQVVELIIPVEAVGDGAFEDYFYAVTDVGVSNRLAIMIYPIQPVGMVSTVPNNRVRTAVRVGSLMPAGEEVTEYFAAYDPEQYIVSSNRAERMPEFSALGWSKMVLSGGTATNDLEDPIDLVLDTQLRWRPLDTELEPRPDLGTGASVWTPTQVSTQGWKFLTESAPYVDPDHVSDSRSGVVTRPAMVFPGDAWMELVNAVPTGPTFSLVMVVQLYATANPRSVILSSNPTGVPDPDAYPLELALIGDELTLTIGTSIATARLGSGYIGSRPVIIGIRTDGDEGGLSVISGTPYNRDFVHPQLDTTSLKLYLGRSNDPASMMIPRMDVLDMGFSDYKFTYTTMWRQMNALDSAYGVSQ